MNETGSNEQEANGRMETAIVVVNGADGLTPDMLRAKPSLREFFNHWERDVLPYFRDPMHD